MLEKNRWGRLNSQDRLDNHTHTDPHTHTSKLQGGMQTDRQSAAQTLAHMVDLWSLLPPQIREGRMEQRCLEEGLEEKEGRLKLIRQPQLSTVFGEFRNEYMWLIDLHKWGVVSLPSVPFLDGPFSFIIQ